MSNRAAVAAALCLLACGSSNRSDAPAGALDVAAAIEEARRLAESTWPEAKLAGIRVGDGVVPGERKNTYLVHVSFEFDADPDDPAAKSAGIMCSPKCVIHRAKVDAIVHPWPTCRYTDAVAAARKAGLATATPRVTYGNWASGPDWEFRAGADDKPILIDAATCTVK